MPYLYENLTYKLRGIFFKVYNGLGPGLKENIYKRAIIKELLNLKIPFEEEKLVEIKYQNEKIGQQRIDLLIDKKLILEIKATDKHHPLFDTQTLTYLKATGLKLALVINFGGKRLIIKRFINEYQRNQ